MDVKAMRRVMEMHIDMPVHKVKYVLHCPMLVEGLWGCLAAYGIEHTAEAHALLVEVVQDKLEVPNFEREWTEEEYKNFVQYKPAGG